MTDEDYYARVRALGLKPSLIKTVFQTLDEQEVYSVPLPNSLTEAEKLSFIETLTQMRQN